MRSQQADATVLALRREDALAEELALEQAFIAETVEQVERAFRTDYPLALRLLAEARAAQAHIDRLLAENGLEEVPDAA